MKREGISTLFIHGYPWALSYLLDHLLLFEIVLCVWFLKVFLKIELRNGSRLYKNAYKVFVSKIVQRGVCEMCFLKVILKRVFFVMALVSIRMRTKCLSFENVSNECVGV